MSETIEVTYEDEDGDEQTLTLPARYEVCRRCSGKGSHVNPNIDGNGITADEWNGPDWDEDSREMYMSGGYDVPCEVCNGLRVVLVPDESRIDKQGEAWQEYQRQEREEAEYRALCRSERLMGC